MGLKDQFGKIKKAYKLQKEVKKIQKELAEYVVTAEHLNGQVKVAVNGAMKVENIELAPEILKAENKTKIEKGLKDAFKEAMDNAQKLAAKQMKDVAGDLGLGL